MALLKALLVIVVALVMLAQDVGAKKPNMEVMDGYGMRCLLLFRDYTSTGVAVSCVSLQSVTGCHTVNAPALFGTLPVPQCYVGHWRDTVQMSFGDSVEVQ